MGGGGVSCKACLQGPWYHKPHDGGKTCYKAMIAAGTASSPASVKSMRKEGEATATRATSEQLGETGQTAHKSRPLANYVRFETKEGVALLCEPHPLYKRIDKDYRWDSKKQLYMDPVTGGTLTAEESEDYQRYLQRHKERRHTGGQADELIKLAAKINPRTLAELRFYIAKFPWEVCRLLAEGKKSARRYTRRWGSSAGRTRAQSL